MRQVVIAVELQPRNSWAGSFNRTGCCLCPVRSYRSEEGAEPGKRKKTRRFPSSGMALATAPSAGLGLDHEIRLIKLRTGHGQ